MGPCGSGCVCGSDWGWVARDAARRGAAVSSACARGIKCNVKCKVIFARQVAGSSCSDSAVGELQSHSRNFGTGNPTPSRGSTLESQPRPQVPSGTPAAEFPNSEKGLGTWKQTQPLGISEFRSLPRVGTVVPGFPNSKFQFQPRAKVEPRE
jgi:hypothetical protein